MSTLKATNIKNESSASNNIVLDSGGGVVVSGILTATTFSGVSSITEGNTSAQVIDTGSDGRFVVTTEGAERLRVTDTGLVGIGTGSPTSLLELQGTTIPALTVRNTTTSSFSRVLLSEVGDSSNFVINRLGSTSTGTGGAKAVQFWQGAAAPIVFATDSTERARIDSSGRLLIGTSTARSNFALGTPTVQHETAVSSLNQGLSIVNNGGSAGYNPTLTIGVTRGTSTGSNTALPGADYGFGRIDFAGADGTNLITGARIEALTDGTPGTNDMPGRLVFSTTADGASSPTERMRIHSNGNLTCLGVYTETSAQAANVFVGATGNIQRSTSSAKYKTDVEEMQDTYADSILQCRPVWYRSTCQADNPAWGWWGFIAEEVAEIDPRLVHWKTTEPVVQENGTLEHVPCEPEPEGVAYDRFVPHLLNLIKRQGEAIAELQAEVAALKAQ